MPKHLIPLSLFAIAMGFLESAVVIYLREIYYPEGFAFPLNIIHGKIAITEILREAATMVMLISVSILAARRWIIRFSWFIFLFAVWDLFYYLFLWLILGWPESLFTWDILFLIPTTWVGPVLAPVINSLTMILLALILLYADQRAGEQADRQTSGPADQRTSEDKRTSGQVKTSGQADRRTGGQVRLNGWEWGLLIAGSLITMIAYMEDYSRYMLERFSLSEWLSLSRQQELMEHAAQYTPLTFDWGLFLTGTLFFFIAISGVSFRTYFSSSRTDKKH